MADTIKVPLVRAKTEWTAGPPPHPNCRCDACLPQPSFPQYQVRTDMLYGVPVLREPMGIVRANDIGRAEADAAHAAGSSYITISEARDYANMTLADVTAAMAVPRDALTADNTMPGLRPDPLTISFTFEDGLHDALKEMSDHLIGQLDTETVRRAMRQHLAAEEERVRYQLLTGEAPPKGASTAEVKAATDYYLATGRLPTPAAGPLPAQQPVLPPAPAHRRAMKLKGKLR